MNGGYTAAVSETSVWKSSERRNTSLGNDHQLGRRGGGGARLLIGTQKQSVPAPDRARVAVQMRNGFEMRSRQHCAVCSCDRCPYLTGQRDGERGVSHTPVGEWAVWWGADDKPPRQAPRASERSPRPHSVANFLAGTLIKIKIIIFLSFLYSTLLQSTTHVLIDL